MGQRAPTVTALEPAASLMDMPVRQILTAWKDCNVFGRLVGVQVFAQAQPNPTDLAGAAEMLQTHRVRLGNSNRAPIH
jgi:hypothetical protein